MAVCRKCKNYGGIRRQGSSGPHRNFCDAKPKDAKYSSISGEKHIVDNFLSKTIWCTDRNSDGDCSDYKFGWFTILTISLFMDYYQQEVIK